MNKQIIKKSKKGFSLPAAIGITAVLIILSASLIIIASSSIVNTSTTVNSRQAYLNVKSALQYAEAYYNSNNNILNLSSGGTEKYQYIIMKDNVGGTVNDGADISEDANSIKDKKTYVVAKYIPATGNEIAKIKLTAYASYSDAFGKKSQTSQLSVTYDAGTKGGRRITDPTIPPSVGVQDYSNNITLNVKKRPNQTWGTIAYYVWTFKDEANAYKNKETSYDVQPTLSQANTNESESNMVRPAGRWVEYGSSDKKGPPAVVSESGGGMLSSTFYPKNGNVNYFNIIFANKGAVLEDGDNTQTCEMFHLWYLDPSDKNVYFEFLKSEPWYYKGGGWNGKDNLEDTVLVYVKNTKTTVHFKIKGVDDTALTPTISAPVITEVTVGGNPLSGPSYIGDGTSKKSGNITMTYEGCGWWVANIESNDTFKMRMTYPGVTLSSELVTVTPNSNNEAWVYADTINGTIQSRLAESSANTALGVDSDSYVTIHAQSYTKKNKVTPALNYYDVQINSSTGRINLYNKILEAQQYISTDYTADSYAALQTKLTEATNMYNDTNFIKNQTGSTTADKIKNADTKYNAKTKELDDAIKALVGLDCDDATYNQLVALVNEGNDIVADQTANGTYDSGDYGKFVVGSGAYQTAKIRVADRPSLTKVEAEKSITELQAAINTLKGHVLDREALENLINSAKTLVNDTKYEKPYRDALSDQITKANVALNTVNTTQANLNSAVKDLQDKINDVEAHPVTKLDVSELTKYLNIANDVYLELNRDLKSRMNCTDETYNNLQSVYDAAKTKLTAKSQTEINAAVLDLKNAIDTFMVVKPDASNDTMNSLNQIRVWVDVPDKYKSYTLNLVKKSDSSVDGVPSVALTEDTASGLSYYDVNKETYSSVGLTVLYDDGVECESNKLDIAQAKDNNMVVKIDSVDGGSSKATVSMQKLTTLYIENKTLTSEPLVTLNIKNEDGTKVDEVKQLKVSSEGLSGKYYYTARFIYAANQTVVINSKSDGSGIDTDEIAVKAGQFVVRYKTDKEVQTINANIIYPIYTTTTASSTGYKISYATIDTKSLVSPTILANVTESYSIALTKSNTQKVETEIVDVDVDVPENKTLVVVNTEGVSAFSSGQTPYGHFYKQGNQVIYSASLLKYKDTNYYYAVVDMDVKGLEIRNGSNKVGGEVIFNNDSKKFVYILVDAQNNNSFKVAEESNTPPKIERTVTPLDATDMVGENLKMAFVGGNKVRATNKSYIKDYGSDQKWNQNHSTKLNDYNKFGGNGGNQGSMNRVGNSKLSPYYDWYEYKIPVDQLANFTFEIGGLKDSGSSTLTEQISSVHGDIWLTLDGTDKDSHNKYTDMSIYTFDPEENQMKYVYDTSSQKTIEKTRIYFHMPAGWSNAKVTTSGIGSEKILSFTNSMSYYSGDTNAVNYYYVDVDINKPFLTFTVQNDKGKSVMYRTSLQGGNTVLFEPNLNGGNGGWNDYTSPQVLLKNEVLKAQAAYYGSVIIGKYDSDGYVADYGDKTYNYAEQLYNQYSNFIHGGSNKTISLQKVYTQNNANAYSSYLGLESWVDAYQNLYAAMASARAYIANPITGGVHPGSSDNSQYPEYKNRKNNQTYKASSITTLKAKLQDAEETYMSTSKSVDEVNKAARTLKAAISNIEVESEGSITVIFFDSQEVVENGAKVYIKYTKSDGTDSGKLEVTDRNPENYPIYRIEDTKATDVKFIVTGMVKNEDTGAMEWQTIEKPAKAEMSENTTWVFMDGKNNPEWSENTTCDYVLFTTDTYEQNSSTDKYTVAMKHRKDKNGHEISSYRDTVLYFKYDTTVTRAGGDSFAIKAGAYVFTNDDASKSDSPFNGGTFNLYSDTSKAYFTKDSNYGKLSGATDASTLGWVDSNGAFNGVIKSTSSPVNFIVKSSSNLNIFRKYTSLGSMYFRYENNSQNLVISNTLTLSAKDFVIASSGVFDGTNSVAPHFYLNGVDYSKDNPLSLTLKSDINIKYRDNTGADHSFIIREGTYKLYKQNDSQSYVADFFDQSYWKSSYVVCTTNGGVGVSNGNSTLSNPVYSND